MRYFDMIRRASTLIQFKGRHEVDDGLFGDTLNILRLGQQGIHTDPVPGELARA